MTLKQKIITCLILFSIPLFSLGQSQEFTIEELNVVAFSSQISTVDSILRSKNYKYKPSVQKGDEVAKFIYYENINRKRYADGVLITPYDEGKLIASFGVVVTKSDDKLYYELKKEIDTDPKCKKMKEDINSVKSYISYSNGIMEYNFYIFNMANNIVYNVETKVKPSIEYYQK